VNAQACSQQPFSFDSVDTYNPTDERVCPPAGNTVTRTYTAVPKDINGGADGSKTKSCIQTWIVKDDVNPTLTVPGATTVECGDPIPLDSASVSDNCANPSLNLVSDTTQSGVCGSANGYVKYTRTRTWRATDSCGNTDGPKSQTITVKDTRAPSFTSPPGPVTAECTESPPQTLTATDACDPNPIVRLESSVKSNVQCTNNYTLTRTWSATDSCSNVDTVSQVITVRDTQAPVFTSCVTNPGNALITCSDASVPAAPDCQGTDNCGTPIRSFQCCPSSGKLTRTWTLTDACGLSATRTQEVVFGGTTCPS
jgi:hypothetical protein